MQNSELAEVQQCFRHHILKWYTQSGYDVRAHEKQIEFYCTGWATRLRQCFAPSHPILESTPPIRVHDVGCGFGHLSLCLAVKFPSSLVTASDISSSYYAVGQAVALELGLSNIRFVSRRIDQLTADDAADVVVASNMLNYFPNRRARSHALESLANITSVGGRLGLYFPHFFVTHEPFTSTPGLHFLPSSLRRVITKRMNKRNLDDVRSPSILFVRRKLENLGLELTYRSHKWPRTLVTPHVGMEFRRPR